MLRVAQTRFICRSCRLELLRLETKSRAPYGCAASHQLRSYPFRRTWRQFSQVHSASTSQTHDRDKSEDPRNADERLPKAEPDTVEGAVISLIEKEFGIPLDQAVSQDRKAVEALVRELSLKDGSEIILEAAKDPLQELRDSGATHTEVVREARNIFGDTLPDGTLNQDETVLYRRLYGEPSPEAEENVEAQDGEIGDGFDTIPPNALYSAEGEKIEYSLDEKSLQDDFMDATSSPTSNEHGKVPDGRLDSDEILTLHEIANSLGGEIVEEDFDESNDSLDDDSDPHGSRTHPLTTLGQFATAPTTVFLPVEEFVRPVRRMMSDFSNKHLKEMCERTFGGPGLPDSPLTPRSGRFKQQIPIPLEAGQSTMGEMEANAFVTSVMPPTYASILSVLVETRKRLGTTWLTRLLAKEGEPRILDASSGGVGIIAWREMVRAHWEAMHSSDRHSPSVPTSKSVVVTGSDALRHRAASMLENTTFIPRLPDYVHSRDIPTLEDDRPAQQRKQFDVIIAPHSLFALKEDWMRKQHVQNLWSLLSSQGGVLILIEKGMPRGFEAIAGAREMLLERYIASPPGHKTQYSRTPDEDSLHKKETAMIVAPCTNHEKCPMYTIPGVSKGRKDICSFQQRYIRPGFLQRILGASDRNHDDVDFSYLSIMKGDDLRTRHFPEWSHVEDPITAPLQPNASDDTKSYSSWLDNVQTGFEEVGPGSEPQSDTTRGSYLSLPATHQLPRAILPPIKRKGHVSLDVCTPAGTIERWTVPRSFSKQAYRDARKSRWGDLWALGAKTRSSRNLSLGVSEKDIASKRRIGEEVDLGKGRGRKERFKIKAQKMLDAREQDRLAEIEEQDEFMKELDEELDISDEDNDISSTRSTQRATSNKKVSENQARSAGKSSKPQPVQSRLKDDDENEDVSRILAEWQSEYDEIESNSRKQARRLNKIEKKKLKKDLRTMHKGRPGV